jgi:xanthine/CO dehydrogenase XdhC/CoxF family maturation factor
MKEIEAIVRHLTAENARGPSVLATLVIVEGSSYRRPGARLLVTRERERIGSISGGCLEEDLMTQADNVAATGKAAIVTYDTTSENDLLWGVGLGCQGVVRVLLERLPQGPDWAATVMANLRSGRSSELAVTWRSADPARLGTRLAVRENGPSCGSDGVFCETISPPTRLFVFGAGNDACPLVSLAKEIGWSVTVADPRPAFATSGRFPSAGTVLCAPADALVDQSDPGFDAVAVVMTHHYVYDLPLLRGLLRRPLAYLGLLGPKKRAEKILGDLESCGFKLTASMRSRLHAPVGLDIGGDSPEVVALSIMAEIQAVLAGRDGRPLRERMKPIHD